MPREWISSDYGPFLVIGAIASFGFIQVAAKVSVFIADLEGERTISHFLILPVNSASIFIYMGFFWGVVSFLLSILLFPLGKLLLFTQLDLSKISYIRLIPIFISANLFYGFFSLWIASLVTKISGLDWLWARVIGPMWMFGAYFYSWEAVFKLSPIIAWVNLVNPIVYIMEGVHAAALGQRGYLPFWLCFLVIWFCIICCTTHAVFRLKKRLDCI